MRLYKILSIISFIFLALALYIIAITPPAGGYELSIYDAYPPYFWLFIIGSIACGICILVFQAFSQQKSSWWLVGFLVIIFSNLIFLTLPSFRGYAIYGRADTLSHLGYIKDILITGHIGEGNFYPILHILGASLLNITGFSQGAMVNLLFAFFSVLFMVNIYLLATVIARNRGQALLVTAFASPLIFSLYQVHIHPSFLSLTMVPLLLYFYHKRGQVGPTQVQNSLLLILLAFLITFFHPITTLFTIGIFLIFGLSQALYRLVAKHKKSIPLESTGIGENYIGLSLIMFIAFFMWYFSYSAIQGSFKMVFDWLIYQTGTPAAEEIIMGLAGRGYTLSQTVSIFISRYGAIWIYLLVSLAAGIIVWKQSMSKRGKPPGAMSFAYSFQWLLALAFGSLMLFSHAPVAGAFPIRVARFLVLIGIALSGLVIYEQVNRSSLNILYKRSLLSARKVMVGLIILIILSSSILSLRNVYFSPMTWLFNYQVTRADIAGTQWFTEHRNIEIFATSHAIGLRRFEHLIYGAEQCHYSGHYDIKDVHAIPSHFGYDQNDSIAKSFDPGYGYMLITRLDRIAPMALPENTRPDAIQYNEDDFTRLDSDPTAAKIYASDEFEVWRIYGMEEKDE